MCMTLWATRLGKGFVGLADVIVLEVFEALFNEEGWT